MIALANTINKRHPATVDFRVEHGERDGVGRGGVGVQAWSGWVWIGCSNRV